MNTQNEKISKRVNPIKVYASLDDCAKLSARALEAGMSLSAYLRTLGLNHRPKSHFDRDAILALVKLHADQGRLGGLLKLWLSSKPNQGMGAQEVRELFKEITLLQQKLNRLVASL
jgi:hypothetical protein